MELQGEDGSVVELSESAEKELGRGPGFAPHDRTVSRRQVRLQVQRIAAPKDRFRYRVSAEVIGPNPICVIHSNGGEVGVAKSGTQSFLEIGDKFSLSIQEPIFYMLQEPVAKVDLGPHRSGGSETPRNGSTSSGKPLGRDEGERNQGTEVADPDEEEGIAEAVARWQRRKQERLQVEQKGLTQEGDRIGGQVGGERKQGEASISQRELVVSNHDPPEADDLGLTDGPRRDEGDTDLVKRFGFVVEGSEFERYRRRGLDTSKWDWQIGRRPANDSDEEEEEEEEEEGGGQVSHDQAGKRSRTTAGSKTNQKAKRASDDDDDDWRGDSEGEKELLSTGKRPVPWKKDVQTRSHATSSEPRKKQKSVSTSEHGLAVNSRQATASTSLKKSTKRKSRAKEEEEEEEDDDGEDLDGFLVDDVEEADEPELADDEDELTDEDEDEDEDENEGVVEEEDEIDAGRGKRNAQLAGHAPAPSRPVKDNELDGGDDKPLCKYGSKCFRKNKDHLAQFRH